MSVFPLLGLLLDVVLHLKAPKDGPKVIAKVKVSLWLKSPRLHSSGPLRNLYYLYMELLYSHREPSRQATSQYVPARRRTRHVLSCFHRLHFKHSLKLLYLNRIMILLFFPPSRRPCCEPQRLP